MFNNFFIMLFLIILFFCFFYNIENFTHIDEPSLLLYKMKNRLDNEKKHENIINDNNFYKNLVNDILSNNKNYGKSIEKIGKNIYVN